MTDKVQKIREEVKKLKSRLIYGACASQIAMETLCKEEAYNEVLAILDSMKEEPVSEDFEKALANEWKGYIDRGAATVDALEDNTQELAFAKGFYRGANWKEHQMIAKAIDGKVIANGMGKPILYLWDKGKHLIDKKVKVIVIEED